MRSTGSNDITTGCAGSGSFLIDPVCPSSPDRTKPNKRLFVLTVSAVYLGIAAAAHQFAYSMPSSASDCTWQTIATLEASSAAWERPNTIAVGPLFLVLHAEQWDVNPDNPRNGDASSSRAHRHHHPLTLSTRHAVVGGRVCEKPSTEPLSP